MIKFNRTNEVTIGDAVMEALDIIGYDPDENLAGLAYAVNELVKASNDPATLDAFIDLLDDEPYDGN